jgi:hypothetical protein
VDLTDEGEVGRIGPFRGQEFMQCVLTLREWGRRGRRGVVPWVRQGLVPVYGGHVVVNGYGGTESQGRACRNRRWYWHEGGERVGSRLISLLISSLKSIHSHDT